MCLLSVKNGSFSGGGGVVFLSVGSGILSVLSVEFLCVCLLSVKNGSFFSGWGLGSILVTRLLNSISPKQAQRTQPRPSESLSWEAGLRSAPSPSTTLPPSVYSLLYFAHFLIIIIVCVCV